MGAPGFVRLETPRLVLRRFSERDLEPFLSYRNDPGIFRFQGWESCTEEEALDLIRSSEASEPGTPGEWFQFAVELMETAGLIGDCALKVDEQDASQAEIGFTLSRPHQGRGLASEAVSHLLNYAFARLRLHRVIAVSDRENRRSIALLERLGMRREGCFLRTSLARGVWRDEYLYAVLREEWLGAGQPPKPVARAYPLPRELAAHTPGRESISPDGLRSACREAGEGLGREDACRARFRTAAQMVAMWEGLDLPGNIAPYALRDARLGYLAGYAATLTSGELPEGGEENAARARWGRAWREKLAAARRRA